MRVAAASVIPRGSLRAWRLGSSIWRPFSSFSFLVKRVSRTGHYAWWEERRSDVTECARSTPRTTASECDVTRVVTPRPSAREDRRKTAWKSNHADCATGVRLPREPENGAGIQLSGIARLAARGVVRPSHTRSFSLFLSLSLSFLPRPSPLVTPLFHTLPFPH